MVGERQGEVEVDLVAVEESGGLLDRGRVLVLGEGVPELWVGGVEGEGGTAET